VTVRLVVFGVQSIKKVAKWYVTLLAQIFACYALLFPVVTLVYVVMPEASMLGAIYCISY
jgi:hypothetical protein